MRMVNARWLRRLVLAFIYTMGVIGILASGGGGGGSSSVDQDPIDPNTVNPPKFAVWDSFNWDQDFLWQ